MSGIKYWERFTLKVLFLGTAEETWDDLASLAWHSLVAKKSVGPGKQQMTWDGAGPPDLPHPPPFPTTIPLASSPVCVTGLVSLAGCSLPQICCLQSWQWGPMASVHHSSRLNLQPSVLDEGQGWDTGSIWRESEFSRGTSSTGALGLLSGHCSAAQFSPRREAGDITPGCMAGVGSPSLPAVWAKGLGSKRWG